ncbi:hypothetical protein Plhal304r1_c056g0141491 [Plasmopara halstedii]
MKIATRSLSLRLCFLLLSCVTVLIYTDDGPATRLKSTPDQLSTSLEERVAPVAVEEEAELLSRVVSYLEPSYLSVISSTSASNEKVATASKLLQDVRLDKVSEGIFNSQEFQKWSELIAKTFPDEPHEGAGIMLITLAKVDKDKLLRSILTTKIENSELTFGVRFKDAMIDYIAIAKDTDDLANDLEKALLDLTSSLLKKEPDSLIAKRLNGEALISRSIKNKKNLVDMFQDKSVRTWYSSIYEKGWNRASIVLNLRLNQQKITNKQIGEAIDKGADSFTIKALDGVVLRRLSLLLDHYKLDNVTPVKLIIKSWFQQALALNADINLVKHKLQDAFSVKQILSFCTSTELHEKDLIAPAKKMLDTITDEWDPKEVSDSDVLDILELTRFFLSDPLARLWVVVMYNRHKDASGSKMAEILFPRFSNDISTLIAAGENSILSDINSLSTNLKKMVIEKTVSPSLSH